VLAAHQFPEEGGGCTAPDAWGLVASPPMDDNEQMADHQIEQAIEQQAIVTGHEPMNLLLNSLGGTDPVHWGAAKALHEHGYAIVRLSDSR